MADFDYEALSKDDRDDDALLKNLRAALRASSKERTDLRAELNTEKSAGRTRTVVDILKSKGVSEKAAKFLPGDIEPSEDAVTAWLEENADVFGIKQQSGTDTPAAEQEAQRALTRAADGMQTPAGDIQAIQKQIREGGTPEERANILRLATGG